MPAERVAGLDSTQQLAVAAHFDDGSVRDVTHLTGFESNEKGLAEVDDRGVVRMLGRRVLLCSWGLCVGFGR